MQQQQPHEEREKREIKKVQVFGSIKQTVIFLFNGIYLQWVWWLRLWDYYIFARKDASLRPHEQTRKQQFSPIAPMCNLSIHGFLQRVSWPVVTSGRGVLLVVYFFSVVVACLLRCCFYGSGYWWYWCCYSTGLLSRGNMKLLKFSCFVKEFTQFFSTSSTKIVLWLGWR